MRWKSIRWVGIALAAAWLVLPVGGCRKKTGELDAMEERLPRMEEAKRRERADDVDGAIELYCEVLADYPDLAKAHLELGLLMDKYRHDDVSAIYHYRRYLELRPDTEKRVMLEQLIQFAEFSFATSITNHPSAVIGEMTRLKGQIATLEGDLDTARGRITELKQNLAEERNRAARVQAQLPAEPAAGAARPTAQPSRPAAIAPEPRTYRVQRGDTLSKIAQKVYKDSSQWKKIYEANRETMKRSSELDVGQVLTIP